MKGKLESILTPRQWQLRALFERGPGGPGGPGGFMAPAAAGQGVRGGAVQGGRPAVAAPATTMTDHRVTAAGGLQTDMSLARRFGPVSEARLPAVRNGLHRVDAISTRQFLDSIADNLWSAGCHVPHSHRNRSRLRHRHICWSPAHGASCPGRRTTRNKAATPAVLDSAAGLKPIGGRWYVREGNPPTYVFKDADTYVDLFSYHLADSNKDGIPNLAIRHDDKALVIASQGYPNHPTAIFPNSGNPNRIRVQDFHFRLPLAPRLAESITRVPMGPIGMALNGVVFFNPFEAGGMNAIEGYSEVWLDSCCGHPQQHGVYHYHKYPSCVKSPFADDGQRHSPVLGFAFDGFPVHGPYEEAGVMAKDLKGDRALDVCNGHTDPPAAIITMSLRAGSRISSAAMPAFPSRATAICSGAQAPGRSSITPTARA